MLRVERIGWGQFSQVPARCGRAPEQLLLYFCQFLNAEKGFKNHFLLLTIGYMKVYLIMQMEMSLFMEVYK